LLGLQVAVAGLLISAMWQLARSEARSFKLSAVLIAGFMAGLFVNAALIVVAFGLLGILLERKTAHA